MSTKQKKVAGGRWQVAGGRHSTLVTRHSPLFLCLLLLTLGAGCRLVQSAANVPGQTVRAVTPGKKDKHAAGPGGGAAKAVAFR